jgi:Zn-dependent membrane protease YugP
MILKASQRAGGQDLAAHLLNGDGNEHVTVHEISGFISLDLKGALKEAYAISLGSKCNQYLFGKRSG